MTSEFPAGSAQLLIVDDDPATLHFLGTLLRGEGYRVQVALEGESALRAAQSNPPDLILLDAHMPGLDGYAVCARLRSLPATATVPIVFLSAPDDALDRVRAFEAGGVDYLATPLEVTEVLARVRCHLTLRRQRRELEALGQAQLEHTAALERESRQRRQAEAELMQANRELERLALLDPLTQLANRRRFDSHLREEWRRLGRARRPLGLILCDVDHFKRYNDRFGHLAGDSCLRQVAQALRLGMRDRPGLVARFAGEEFVLLLPDTDEDQMRQVLSDIQHEIAALELPHPTSDVASTLTLSLGACLRIPGAGQRVQQLLACADQAMYQAKEGGRNQSVLVRLPEKREDSEQPSH